MRSPARIAVFSLVFLLSLAALAAEYHVNLEGTGDFSVIQEAIDAAIDGDTIIVHPGTYYENVQFGGMNVVLTSTAPDDTETVANTIIDGGGEGSVVTFSGDEDETCELRGFTIQNGEAQNGGGVMGGPEDELHSLASISNCLISGNKARLGGGLYGCDGKIEDCWINQNSVTVRGGGLYDCRGEVVRCVISGNRSDSYAGAVSECDGLLINCLICDNSAPWAGAVEADNRSPTIKNCTITGNMANQAGGLYRFSGKVFNSIIWGNWAPEGPDIYEDYASFAAYNSCIGGWSGAGSGNISDDPLFADAVDCDYHLSVGSPCIDAGDNQYAVGLKDVEGRARIASRTIDMGAYEYPRGCYVYVEADERVYAIGETANLSIQAGSADAERLVDVYAAIRVPGGELFFIPSLSSDMTPWAAGVSLSPGSLFVESFDYELTEQDPSGNYIVYSALFEHGSKSWDALLTDLSETSFVYGKGEPNTYEVRKDGSGDFTTIQKAIDAALDGDTIVVYPGVYYENIGVFNKNLTLMSSNPDDPTVVEQTVIDGSQKGSVVTFNREVDERTVLSGFTITHGQSAMGGGISGVRDIWDYMDARPTIRNCIVRDNECTPGAFGCGAGVADCDGIIEGCVISDNNCDDYGGGLSGCSGRIEHCLILSNTAHDGGGLFGCGGEIISCEIRDNGAVFYGGGLYRCDGRIVDCTIDGNHAYQPGTETPTGGAAFAECNGSIERCIISNNVADYSNNGAAFYSCHAIVSNCLIVSNSGGSIFSGTGTLVNCTVSNNSGTVSGDTIRNCIVWGNTGRSGGYTAPMHSCIESWSGGGEGNISDDPLFVDPANGDYRLLPGSPCVNTGANSAVIGEVDAVGLPRIIDRTVDMGACENANGCSISICAAGDFGVGRSSIPLVISAGSFGVAREVDICAAIARPDGEVLFLPSLSTSWLPWASGLELQPGGIWCDSFSYAFSDNDPRGIYTVYAAVFAVGTTDLAGLLTNLAGFSFKYPWGIPAELHVRLDGDGDSLIIQRAIDVAEDGDTVIIHPGTYNENIHLKGKNISLRSIDPLDEQIVASTIIRGIGEDAVVSLAGTENGTCAISGLTITNERNGGGAGICGAYWSRGSRARASISDCRVAQNGGAGILYCDGPIQDCVISGNSNSGLYGCNGDISRCRVLENNADWFGGGLQECRGAITNCLMVGNHAGRDGGGLYYCDGAISNCLVAGNNSGVTGGGLSSCDGPITNCLIVGNVTDGWGGGLYYCDGSICNCTIKGNHAGESSGGLHFCGGNIIDCIIWQNTAIYNDNELATSLTPRFSCIRDWTGGGEGNISEDPLFTSGPLGDYYIAPNSPCIDAGSRSAESAGLSERTTQTDGAQDTGLVDMGFHYPILTQEK